MKAHWKPWSLARRWFPLLILGPLVAMLAASLVARRAPPVYQSSAIVLVGPSSLMSISTEPIRAASELAKTYEDVVRTRPVLTAASDQAGRVVSAGDLWGKVQARRIGSTNLLRITVEDSQPDRAAVLANAVANAFVANVGSMSGGVLPLTAEARDLVARALRTEIETRSQRIEQLRGLAPAQGSSAAQAQSAPPAQPSAEDDRAGQLSNDPGLAPLLAEYRALSQALDELGKLSPGANQVTVLETALPPDRPVATNAVPQTLLAGLAGLGIAILFALAVEYWIGRPQDPRHVRDLTGAPPLGMLPLSAQADPGELDSSAMATLAQRYQLLGDSLLEMRPPGRESWSLTIASGRENEGASAAAAILAVVLAEDGRQVVLVDADLRQPTQNTLFSLSNRSGLSTLLLDSKLKAVDLLQQTTCPRLRILTAGPDFGDPSALLASPRLHTRLAELQGDADIVIVDAPPALMHPDAAAIGSRTDAVVLVIDMGRARWRDVKRAAELLTAAGAMLAGTILNSRATGVVAMMPARDAKPEAMTTQSSSSQKVASL